MKILNRKEFLKMPVDTVYSRLPQLIEVNGLEIKGESIEHGEGYCDWMYFHFIGQVESSDSEEYDAFYFDMEENGTEHPMQVVWQRDGAFDETEKFVVYSHFDVRCMIEALSS